jgi:hypothetical protein
MAMVRSITFIDITDSDLPERFQRAQPDERSHNAVPLSACRAKAENICSQRVFRLLTQRGH